MRFLPFLILGAACLAIPASAAERVIASDPAIGVKVYADIKSGALHLRSVGPAGVKIGYSFDIDDDGRIDPGRDMHLTASRESGSLCAFVAPSKEAPKCGSATTTAQFADEVSGAIRTRRLAIPIAEINKRGKHLSFQIVYNSDGTSRTLKWMRIDLQGRDVARAAAAAIPAAQSSSQLFYRKPGGLLVAMELGHQYRITPTMVTQPRRDMFSEYLYEAVVRGRVGDKFHFAWLGAETFGPKDYTSSTYEIDFPSGQSIFDLSRAMTITLTKAGDHSVVFSQIGKAYSKERQSGIGPVSIGEGTPRAFVPVSMTVTRR